jgi:hypothetical protein
VPAAATAEPTALPSLRIVTVLPASAVPVKVGVVTLVILSVLDAPLSDASARSGTDGAVGAVVSIVTDNTVDATLTLPATSAAVAVMLWVPAASAEVVML